MTAPAMTARSITVSRCRESLLRAGQFSGLRRLRIAEHHLRPAQAISFVLVKLRPLAAPKQSETAFVKMPSCAAVAVRSVFSR